MREPKRLLFAALLLALASTTASAQIYLNDTNISVALGPSMAAEPFANRTAAEALASRREGGAATTLRHPWLAESRDTPNKNGPAFVSNRQMPGRSVTAVGRRPTR